MRRTKTDIALEAAEKDHADDPERAEVIHRARRFKSSWVELGEALTEVRKEKQWKDWGYESFEEYGKKELSLRADTLEKLTGSFMFLKQRAPEVLKRDGVSSPIPTYQSVDFLRRAESQNEAPEEVVNDLRRRVIDECAPLPSIAKQFRESVFPVNAVDRKERDTAGLRNVATRLRDLLAETHVVPSKLVDDVTASIRKLLDALSSEERAA